jgi:hypothetical protein
MMAVETFPESIVTRSACSIGARDGPGLGELSLLQDTEPVASIRTVSKSLKSGRLFVATPRDFSVMRPP